MENFLIKFAHLTGYKIINAEEFIVYTEERV